MNVANYILSYIPLPHRDPAPSDKEKLEQILRLERMIVGGYRTEKCCSGSADGKSKDGRDNYGGGDGGEAAGTAVEVPFDRYMTRGLNTFCWAEMPTLAINL